MKLTTGLALLAATVLGMAVGGGAFFYGGSDTLFAPRLCAGGFLFLGALLFRSKLRLAGFFCGVAGVTAAALLVGAVASVAASFDFPRARTFNDPMDANTTWRSDKPLTFEQAEIFNHCPIALPKEASSIQFVDFHAGLGGYRRFVRFKAAPEVCQSHALSLLETHNKALPGNPARPPSVLTSADAGSSRRYAIIGEKESIAE